MVHGATGNRQTESEALVIESCFTFYGTKAQKSEFNFAQYLHLEKHSFYPE